MKKVYNVIPQFESEADFLKGHVPHTKIIARNVNCVWGHFSHSVSHDGPSGGKRWPGGW